MNYAVKIMQKWRRAKLVKDEYFSLVQDGYLTVGIALMRMGISEEECKNLMNEWQEQEGEENGTSDEQKMLEELAEFVLRFNEKYQVLLNIKIKPMRKGRKGAE